MRFKTFYLTEEVVGRNVTFYHRTGAFADDLKTHIDDIDKSSFLSKIKNQGLKIGKGDLYGKGIYGTYDLKSQLNAEMNVNFGSIIIKMKAIMDRVLIFDYDISKK